MDVPTLKMKITAKVQVISEAAAIALITALTYVIFLPRFYNFDGVACAMAVEIGKANQLFHGNHLVYGFTGFLFDRALRLVGYGGGSFFFPPPPYFIFPSGGDRFILYSAPAHFRRTILLADIQFIRGRFVRVLVLGG